MSDNPRREALRAGLAVMTASVCALAVCVGAAGGQWKQIHKLVADDGSADDLFGYSVSVSGKIIVVGAPEDNHAGVRTGSAYIFDAYTGKQIHKLTSDEPQAYEDFGCSVAVSGDLIIVGAQGGIAGSEQTGSAFLFDAATGEQLHKLTADDGVALDLFGCSVAISGKLAVIGARWDDCPGHPQEEKGSAYVFDADTGEQLFKLIPDDCADVGSFGYSVAIGGDTIVVGDRDNYDADVGRPGAAYVFDATTGEQVHKNTADDAEHDERFGYSVSISGDTCIISAPHDDDAGPHSGSAYVFNALSGEQQYKLIGDDTGATDYFGRFVGISGNNIVVGAPMANIDDFYPGAAYIFDASTGGQLGKLLADDAEHGDSFGNSVSICGEILVVAAVHDDDAGDESGSAYIFRFFDSPCPADVTGVNGTPDGAVDVHDLLLVLAQWDTAAPDCDITGPDGLPDGVVNVHDLLALLGAWGPCP